MKFKKCKLDESGVFDNNYLLEATFKGKEHLKRHWQQHTLMPGEKFNIADPKFNNMTQEEYYAKAEKATLEKASIIQTGEELKTAKGVIGWVEDKPMWRHPRNVKINTSPKDYPGCITIVAYVDDSVSGNQILTYMLARKSKKYREFANKVDELKENIEE